MVKDDFFLRTDELSNIGVLEGLVDVESFVRVEHEQIP